MSENAARATLRKAREDDVAVLCEIRNDARLQEMLLARPRRNSPADVRDWIKRKSEAPDGAFFVIAEPISGRPLGFLQLTAIDTHSGHAQIGLCIIDSAQGTGVGKSAMAQAEEYACQRGLKKLVLYVRADNWRATRLYELIGFRKVGTLEDHYQTGNRMFDVALYEKKLNQL